jgi:squalene-associated FAD-dependent desaturase
VTESKKSVVIIGAGVAGSAAAVELSDNNFNVILLEARKSSGGRMNSYIDPVTGEHLDNGQHAMTGAYVSFLRLIRELGTHQLLYTQDALKVLFLDADGVRDMFDTSRLPGKAGTVLGMLSLKGISWSSKLKFLSFLAKLSSGKVLHEDITALEMLRRYKQPADIIIRFWEPLILAVMNIPADQASAALLIEVLNRAFFADAESSRMIFPKQTLGDLFGALPEYLKSRGSALKLNARVKKINIENERVRSLTINDGSEIVADYYISAIPPDQLLKLCSDHSEEFPFIEQLSEYKYSTIASIYLWYDNSITEDAFGAMLGTQTQWFFNRRALCNCDPSLSEKYPGHLALTISGAGDLNKIPNSELVKICDKELKRAFPNSSDAKLLHS